MFVWLGERKRRYHTLFLAAANFSALAFSSSIFAGAVVVSVGVAREVGACAYVAIAVAAVRILLVTTWSWSSRGGFNFRGSASRSGAPDVELIRRRER